MTIAFHFLDAGRQLTPWLPRTRELLSSVEGDVARLLHADRIDVVTYVSDEVIPELGVNGFSEGRHLMHLKLDPRNVNFVKHFETAVPSLFAHEVHHCMREGCVGYGATLRGALISEGLACHFEAEVTGRAPFYATALSPAQVDAMLQRMLPQLDAAWYNHPAWFFGSPREEIPRNCGYSVGFGLVGAYLTRNGLTASGAVGVPVASFFN
ncbi:Predicted Zn-dependent protease [Variovorax sp. YR750]|uniref:DUF2268 domain-containing putative Zn-dependent protease n=1 Tax=Variovorax sp. YR750 TaxID=1884384 RepID=UPI0008C873CD|nr:DUF2268 domain-containing putative Zn-dependent protease [Variovorax sp. YR750]SEM43263.1 Predicted Zn-dependent protease [Variovorax sp. YR750]